VRDHPGPAGRKALGASFATFHEPRGSARAAGAAGAVGIAHRRQCARRIRTPLIGGVGDPRLRRHRRAMRGGENDARRARLALRTIGWQLIFRHRSHPGKRSAIPAQIFVNRHDVLLDDQRPASIFRARRHSIGRRATLLRAYLSGDIGMSTPPLICLMGPDAFGMTSNSKMSVGSHNVAQALGMSTTPEMWPCTGAVPRIA
jgi:hypothetical protein